MTPERLAPAVAVLAALVLSASAGANLRAAPTVVETVKGQVLGVAQDGGTIAILESAGGSCRTVTISRKGPVAAPVRRTACVLPGSDLALAKGRVAWGGFQDVRCSETTAAVFIAGRLVQSIPGECQGFGTSFQGLASDGSTFLYALLVTGEPPGTTTCGEGGGCHWKLTGGRIVEIAGHKPSIRTALPLAVLIAADAGRVALVPPALSGSSDGQTFDWPHAAPNGKVEIRGSATSALIASFEPAGIVRAVALSGSRAVVLVEGPDGLELEWYDASTGARVGRHAVPFDTTTRIASDGNVVAFAAGKSIAIVDLGTGEERVVAHAGSAPIGLSVSGGLLAWGENTGTTGRVLTLGAGS